MHVDAVREFGMRGAGGRRALVALALTAMVVSVAPARAHAGSWQAKLLVGTQALPLTGSGCSYQERTGCVPGYAGQNLTFIDVHLHAGDAYSLTASSTGPTGQADFDVCFLNGAGGVIRCDRNHAGAGSETGKSFPPNATEARVELYLGLDAGFTLRTT